MVRRLDTAIGIVIVVGHKDGALNHEGPWAKLRQAVWGSILASERTRLLMVMVDEWGKGG